MLWGSHLRVICRVFCYQGLIGVVLAAWCWFFVLVSLMVVIGEWGPKGVCHDGRYIPRSPCDSLFFVSSVISS